MNNNEQQPSQFSVRRSNNEEQQRRYAPGGPVPPSLPDTPQNVPPGINEQSPFYDPNMTMDMGHTLGYNQTMEFQASGMAQPSQSITRIRQSRLQELREERMRRQQRRGDPDASFLGRWSKRITPGNSATPLADRRNPQVLPVVPALPQSDLGLQPASEPSQDTAMLQRVKVARAAFMITGAFMFSSVLGLLRTFLFSSAFGATGFSDSFLQAYIIPNLLFTVISGGALSSAFIPVFTRYAEGLKDEKSAWHIASSALNLSVVVIIALSALAMIFAPELVPLYSPGFTPAQLALITTLTRIMLLQAIVLGSGVIVSSVLNAKQDFSLTATGTVLYNVGQIVGLLPGVFLAWHAGNNSISDVAIYSATWGVVLAAVLQVGVQIPGLFKVKMRYTFAFDWRHPGVRQIARQMVPRTINAAMLSFSTAVDRYLLSFLGTVASSQVVNGLITEYFYAFSILVLPVSIFGSSVSTAAFPTLASYVARERFDRVRSIIMETLRSILFLSIPSCIGLMVLSLPVIQVLQEHGSHFTLQNAQFTMVPLAFFATGLPGLAAVEILTRAFYALRDSRTPVIISVAQFVLKIALSVVLINVSVFGVQWGMGALAFSTSVASTIEAVVLFILLYRRIGGFDLLALTSFIGRSLAASIAMGIALILVRTVLDTVISTTHSNTLALSGVLLAAVKLLIELGIGSLVFLVVARLLKIEELNSGPVRRILDRLHISWL